MSEIIFFFQVDFGKMNVSMLNKLKHINNFYSRICLFYFLYGFIFKVFDKFAHRMLMIIR